MIFAVVTKISDTDLAGAMPGQVARVDPANPNGPPIPFDAVQAILGLRVQVFTLGEVLLLDGEYGRELVGIQRKPSKWGVTVEHFSDLDEAVARAQQIRES